jgi:transposase
MRQSDPPVLYLVGTPKGRLSKLEERLRELPWKEAREGVEVKLVAEAGEVDVLAKSKDRVNKERAMRRRQLKGLWKRLHELQEMDLNRDALLMKLGAARQQAPRAWRLVKIKLPKDNTTKLEFSLLKNKLRQVRRREGRYLLRSNMCGRPEEELWEFYMQLAQVEEAFKHLKSDLVLRPFHHKKEQRIEAHIFVAFLAYCLQVTLRRRLKDLAPGLTARSVLEKLGGMQMIDVHLPTTDGREVILSRYTQPEPEQRLLLEKLKLQLPEQPPPKITSRQLATQ